MRRLLERYPGSRRRHIHLTLFAGCKTGRVLQRVFGSEHCRDIVWEEISKEIGGESSSSFPADQTHITAVLDELKPSIVLVFGKLAEKGVTTLHRPLPIVLIGPHPTARHSSVINDLEVMRLQYDRALKRTTLHNTMQEQYAKLKRA